MKQEFEEGQVVTVDRYNHIDDVSKGTIVAFVNFTGFGTEKDAYKINLNGLVITTRGGSIVESKDYNPVPDEDRHEKIYNGIFNVEQHK